MISPQYTGCWIRDQLLSCAGEDFSGAKYFPIAHSNRDLNYSGLIPTATTLIPDHISDGVARVSTFPPLPDKGYMIRDQFWLLAHVVNYLVLTQPEVVPRQLLLCLVSQEAYPIYSLTRDLSSGIYN